MLLKHIKITLILGLLIFFRGTTCASAPDTVKIWTETTGLGHVWISSGFGTDLVIYSYGNYAAPPQKSFGAKGLFPARGVMLRLEGKQAYDYISYKIATCDVYEFMVTDVADESIREIGDSLFFSNYQLPKTGRYKNKRYARHFATYRLLRYNCTTFAMDILHESGTQLFCKKRGNQRIKGIITPYQLKRFLRKKSHLPHPVFMLKCHPKGSTSAHYLD